MCDLSVLPQDMTGAVSDSFKKSATGPVSASSSSDALPSATLNTEQGEGEGDDLSKKDKVNIACILFCNECIKTELWVTFHFFQQYLKKLHMQERAIEEVKLAIKPFYQRRDITKDEYKEILRKAVQKVSLK